MRTKKILLTAVLTAATTFGALAADNVYSVNVVGYVTKQIEPGFNLIGMPLKSTNYTLAYLIPAPPQYTVSYILNTDGSGYSINTYDPDLGGWDPNPAKEFPLGTGTWLLNPLGTPFSITFVGEVAQGLLSNTVPVGFSIQSSQVPQNTNVATLGVQPVQYDVLYKFTPGPAGGFQIVTFDPDLGGWDPCPGCEVTGPTIDVGEAFVYQGQTGSQITRTFTVN